MERRVALVTGASRGIGRGIALELARLGWGIAVHYGRNQEQAAASVAACRAAGAPWCESFQADLALRESHRALLDTVWSATGGIDCLVNNAGMAPTVRSDVLEMDVASWDTVMRVNLEAPFFLSQWLVNRWLSATVGDSGRDEGRRFIVNIGSISAETSSIQRGEYCVAKAGLAMATQILAHRLADEGILVYEVRPGIMRTDMTEAVADRYEKQIQEGLVPQRRWGTAQDVGLAVAAIVEEKFPFSTGQVFHVDGGFHLRRL